MTSQESIGSCSLDVDQSASDRSESTAVDTVSKKTLHSLTLSCNGDSVSSPDNLANGSSETLHKSHLSPDEKLNVSNGHRGSPEPEQLTVKKPSYLGLACSISGYSGINRYDSKLRDGFRSRDSSPGTRLITRDTSPAGFRSNETLDVPAHLYPPKSQSISPLAMDRQNGFSNGMKEECKVEAYRESRSSISICQGYSEVDKGVLHAGFPDISPIRPSNSVKRSPGMSQMMSCSQQNKHFSISSPKQASANLSNASFSDTSILNGSSEEMESQVTNNTTSSEKSFIQQRVERLYGPGALAQGFFFKRSTSRLNSSDSFNKSSNNNDVSAENANTEESLKNLPVLRHLRPEFRAQLPVVSSRRATDGSEQILKPLQRVTPGSRKVEQKPKIPTATNLDGNLADSSAQKLNSSVTSIPDQQPAAPKVVLPVLEPSASSTNVAKQVQEAEKTVEEKNGHYFMKLLKQETDRLFSLAASAEAELASGDTVALPEEAAGKLRSAAGKARLLASQKMQQFEGLCQKNINQVPGEEFPTTNEDLAGFWDMVMLQVVQVNELFDQIEKLRNSQWQEVCSDSVHPETPHSRMPAQRNPYPDCNSDRIKRANIPSCRSSSHSVKDKRVRFDITTFSNAKESNQTLEQFPLETRLCDDAFQVLTLSKSSKQNDSYCENCDENILYLSDSATEIQPVENDNFLIHPTTSYVVNYANILHANMTPFYLEDSCNSYPRGDFFDNDFPSKFEVLFKRDELEQQKNNDSVGNRGEKEYFEPLTGDTKKRVKDGKSDTSDTKDKFLYGKKTTVIEKRKETVRSKVKSCSPVGRNLKYETKMKDYRRTRSHTPENKQRKNDLIKSSVVGQHNYRNLKPVDTRRRDEEKVSVPSKNDRFPYKSPSPSRKENVKKPARNVHFSDDIQRPSQTRKGISSGNSGSGNVAKSFTKSVSRRSERNSHLYKTKNATKASRNFDRKSNFTIVSDAWSNLDSLNDKRKLQGKTATPEENCTFAGTWNVKNRVKEPERKKQPEEIERKKRVKEQVKEFSRKIEQEPEVSSDISDSVFWRLSDSKPFIPLSCETLRQLRQVYNTGNQVNLSATSSKSEKWERIKFYDKRRKQICKRQDYTTLRKVISRSATSNSLNNHLDNNFANEIDIEDINSISLQDETGTTSEIVEPMHENCDFSIQCLISSSNLRPCVMNAKNESTFVINNITNNISKWSNKDENVQNILSVLLSPLSSEIVTKVAKRSGSRLKNRVSIKKLSYGLITNSLESSSVNANVLVDISQHVHSDFVVRPLPERKSGKSIKSIDFDNYLPLKRGFNVNRYLEDLKYIHLFPDSIEIESNLSDTKSFQVKVRHFCTFLKSNRTLCRLSLYLYVYGVLSLVLIFLKIGSNNQYFLDPRLLYNSY